MHPFFQPWFCMVSGLVSFKLSKLNIIVVISLLVSESTNWGWELCPFVIKGPLSSIQVHWRLEFGGGYHFGLSRNVVVLLPKTELLSVSISFCASWETSLVVGILGSISLETSELTSVWGVVRGSLGAKEHKRTIRGMQMHMARNIKVKHVNSILDYGRVWR